MVISDLGLLLRVNLIWNERSRLTFRIKHMIIILELKRDMIQSLLCILEIRCFKGGRGRS